MPTAISPGGYIKVQELDGSPAKDIKQLIITNGKLIDAGAGAFQLQQFFKDLEDVGLADYTGLAGQVFQVNDTEDGVGPGTTYDIVSLSPQIVIAEDGANNRMTFTFHPPAPAIMGFNHSATNNDATTATYASWPQSNQRWHWWDLTYATQASLTVKVVTTFAASTRMRVEYTLDMTGATGWTALDNSSGPSVTMATAGVQLSGWATITAAARAEVLLRLALGGAINAASLGQTIGTVELMVR